MVTTDSIHALKKQLTAANKASDAQTCVDVLMRLESEVEATTELLKETLIGAAVNKVAREPCSTGVANLASRLVTKWKDAIGATSSKAGKSGSTTGSPPLPPSPVSPSSPDPAASPRKNSDGYFPPLLSTSTAPHASTSRAPHARATIVTRTSSKRLPPSDSAKPAVEPSSKRLKQDSGVSRSSSKDGTPAPPPKEEKKKADPPRTHKTDRVDLAAAFSPGKKKKKDDLEAKVTAARVASCNALYDALACDSKAANEAIVSSSLEIERAVWSAFPPPEDSEDRSPTAAYKTKLRFLITTLKGAQLHDCRERIVRRELGAETLVGMKPTDFLTDERKALDEKARLASLQSAQISALDVAEDIRNKALWRPGGR
ncbi:transcription elongation factor TFIIS [Rhodotorula kratochvilovae]